MSFSVPTITLDDSLPQAISWGIEDPPTIEQPTTITYMIAEGVNLGLIEGASTAEPTSQSRVDVLALLEMGDGQIIADVGSPLDCALRGGPLSVVDDSDDYQSLLTWITSQTSNNDGYSPISEAEIQMVSYLVNAGVNVSAITGASTSEPLLQTFLQLALLIQPMPGVLIGSSKLTMPIGGATDRSIWVAQGSNEDKALAAFPTLVTEV